MVKQSKYKFVAKNIVNLLKKDINLIEILKDRAKSFNELLTKKTTTYNILGQKFRSDLIAEACFCILTANFRADKAILMQKDLAENNCFNFDKQKITQILKKHGHRFVEQRVDRIIKLQSKLDFLQQIRKHILTINEEFLTKFIKSIELLTTQQENHFINSSFYDIVSNLEKTYKLRNNLIKSIDGYGLKEASHFLRNIGLLNVSIIDRHILRYLLRNNLLNIDFIDKGKKPIKMLEPKITITKSLYIKAEKVLLKLSIAVNQYLRLLKNKYLNSDRQAHDIHFKKDLVQLKDLIITPSLLDLILFYKQTGNLLK